MASPAAPSLIWTGTYTSDGGGRATGIGALAARPDGTLEWLGTAVEADSPSFVAVHPTLPVACHVAVDPAGRFLTAACWPTGGS